MLNFMLCKIKVENIFHLFSIFLHLFILFKQKFIIEMHFAIMQRIMKKKKLTNGRCFPNQKWMRYVIIVSIEDIR